MELVSLLFSNSEIKLHFDFFESNIFNISFIFALFVYIYKTFYKSSLESKQKEILQLIENSEKTLEQSINFYFLAEQFYQKFLFVFSDANEILKKKKFDILFEKSEKIKELIRKKNKLAKKLISKDRSNQILFTKQYLTYFILAKIIKKYLVENSSFKYSSLVSILKKAQNITQ